MDKISIKYKLKLYPISESGEVIYHGGMLDVIRIDFSEKWVECKAECTNALVCMSDMMLGRRRLDRWYYGDNRDERDKQSELWVEVDGELYKTEN